MPDNQTPMGNDSSAGATDSHETSLQTNERTLKTFSSIALDCPNKPSSEPGHFTVTDRRLIWRQTPEIAEEEAWRTSFIDVSLHALSTDPDSGYPPCVYAQIGDDCVEVRFIPIPEDSETLREMYDVMCEGAALCVDSEGEDEDAGGMFGGMAMPFMAENGASEDSAVLLEGAAERLAMYDRLLDGASAEAHQFDDAVENDEGETNGG